MSTSTKPVVTYFPITYGRAFSIRAALKYAKYDFIDNRVPGKVFATEYKPDPSKAPLGALPVLTIPQGAFTQSTALARWAARKSDLYPKDDLEQLIVDEVMETASEMMANSGSDKDPAIKKAQRESYAENVLPKFLNLISARIQQSGGPFVLGKNISIADLFVFGQLYMVGSGNLDYVSPDLLKKFPLIHTFYTEVEKHPIARAELESSKQ